MRFNSIEPRTGDDVVSRLRAWDGSVEEIERGILLREKPGANDTPEEAWIFDQKSARLLKRGDRKASGQLGQLGRQGHESPENENPRINWREGVENSRKAQVVNGTASDYRQRDDTH